MDSNNGKGGNFWRFESISQSEVPRGREGKHKKIILQVLEAIDGLKNGSALRIPLSELPDTKENIRSALNRATRQRKIELATASDSRYLYIWRKQQC